jgi:hypothetical protein
LSRADGRLAPRVGLEDLAGHEYPAERCAAPDPVSELHDQAVIVTEHLDAVPRAGRREAIRQAGGLRELGAMLGRLTALPAAGGAPGRTGGSWHHLTDGGPDDELAAVAKLLDASPPAEDERAYRTLRDAVTGLDAGDGLPRALAHPDFVLANAVATTDGRIVMVDWAGAGTAPRVWPLAFLLWSVGFDGDLRRVDRVVAGYRHPRAPRAGGAGAPRRPDPCPSGAVRRVGVRNREKAAGRPGDWRCPQPRARSGDRRPRASGVSWTTSHSNALSPTVDVRHLGRDQRPRPAPRTGRLGR